MQYFFELFLKHFDYSTKKTKKVMIILHENQNNKIKINFLNMN